MKTDHEELKTLIIAFCFASGLTLLLWYGSYAQAAMVYRITDLGDLPGGQDRSFAIDINNAGWIAGEATGPGGPRAAVWKRNGNGTYTLVNLGVAPGDNSSLANSISPDNTLVGRSSQVGNEQSRKAIRWIPQKNGTYTGRGLGTRDCANQFALRGTEAFSINASGWTVGLDDDCSFVWKPGQGMSTVNQAGNSGFERLVDVSNTGIAAGTYSGPSCCAPMPIAWDTNTNQPMFLFFTDSFYGYAEGVNSKGWIVGQDGAHIAGCCDTRAVIWIPRTPYGKPDNGGNYSTHVIGPPENSPTAFTKEARALDINRHDEVVGNVQTVDPTTGKLVQAYAFYWRENVGFLDLNKQVAYRDPLRGKFRLIKAFAISDRGLIVGHGLTQGKSTHAFLLTPQ